GRQIDPLKRLEVEKRAISCVTKYFKNFGYEVQSVEKDNCGWDLIASSPKTELKLEVKGLSGVSVAAELTPNEFDKLKKYKVFYRLCIVTNALKKPTLRIFAHSKINNEWISDDGTVIKLSKMVGARVNLK